MKTREQKQKDLEALARRFQEASSAMVIGFKNMTVAKDQELRKSFREAGADYSVIKNTLARRAAEGTQFEKASEQFKGVTAVALSKQDPVSLSKAVSKFARDNAEIFTFKAGVVEGKVVSLGEVESIASLPSKEVLISRIMFLLNCQAQRLATVISAVPRNLAVVVRQISDQIGEKSGGNEVS